jgi:hypothetical protein
MQDFFTQLAKLPTFGIDSPFNFSHSGGFLLVYYCGYDLPYQ